MYLGESEDEANLRLRSLEIAGDSDKLGGTSQNDYRLEHFLYIPRFNITLALGLVWRRTTVHGVLLSVSDSNDVMIRKI